MQMTITETEKEDLLLYKDMIFVPNRAYTHLEQQALYNLYNRIYGTSKQPNGCGSCLRATLGGLKKALAKVEAI